MIEQENGDLTEKSPLLKMIDDIIQTKLYSINDEIRRIISELLELSAKYHDIVTIVNELPSIKTEIAKDAALLNSFKANGLEQKRKSFEIISQGIKLTRNNALTYQQYLQTIINGFCQKRDEYGLTLAKISDDKILSADAITLINTLLKSCDTIIDTLLTEQENLDNQIKQFEVSEIHDKKSELEKEYLELVGKIKITGSENIQTIQNRLQENRIREAELEILKVEKNKLSQKINDKIEEFISKRIELTEKRNVAIKEIQTEGINISIRSIANIIKWKKRLQKEFGKSDTFESDFSALAEFVLCQDNNYKNYKSFLRFILMSEKGLINDELITEQSFDKRFNNLWYDRAMHGTLSSLINVVPEDKIEIKIKQNNEEIDISYGSPGQKCAALLSLILNIGDNPLIIDQPEDDLDNSLIYNLIVKSIRKMKNRRQIIIVTHNPNIPVLGDAEGIIILERDAQGKVGFRKGKKIGCIEEKIIRTGICEVMEGGSEAFKKREEKYRIYIGDDSTT